MNSYEVIDTPIEAYAATKEELLNNKDIQIISVEKVKQRIGEQEFVRFLITIKKKNKSIDWYEG